MPEPKPSLTIIGAGPGGYTAAVRARQLGFAVTVVERERAGGVSVNWGCIPSKSMLHGASLFQTMRKSAAYGIQTGELRADWPAMVERSRGIAERYAAGIEFLFTKHCITTLKGQARLVGPNTVLVQTAQGEQSVKSNFILIAAGARPRDIPGVKRDGQYVLSYHEALQLRTLPAQLAVIGGGALGCEFAYLYSELGSKVTVLESKPRLLHHEDEEISQGVRLAFTRRGIQIETGARVKTIHHENNQTRVAYEMAGTQKSLTVDVALVMIGVVPNVEALGLKEQGIQLNQQGIEVNDHFQTAAETVYAVGDVIGPPWLSHVAAAQGKHAVEHMGGLAPAALDMLSIPACTYCRPEVASVGYTEQQARDAGIDYTISRFPFKSNARALVQGETDGMIKLLFDRGYGGLIGAHIVGGEAAEMIHQLALALRMEATAEDLAHMVYSQPSLSEAIMQAALNPLGERIHGA